MKYLAAALTAFLFTVPAHAGRFLPHKRHLTLEQKVAYFQRSLRHEHQVVAWLESAKAPRTLQRRSELGWYRAAVRWHSSLLAQYQAKLAPVLPPHYTAWLCIHSYEGSWTDSGAPYWGGLQMDYSFMEAYGADLLRAEGTADHWSPLEQMWVAEKAWKSRGFWPWPNTARYCGLL